MANRARLAIIAGKGGVGRTTVAVALSQALAGAGRSVLLIEAVPVDVTRPGERASVAAPTEISTPEGSYRYLRLSTQASLDEYLTRTLRLPISPGRLGPLASVFDFVSVAAPGVREILTVGKIGHEVLNGGWDDVIVDGPASGHVIEMLTAPSELKSMVGGLGPLARESTWLAEVLSNSRTEVVVVSLPEPLAVAETTELLGRLEQTEVSLGAVVANRLAAPVGQSGRVEARELAQQGGGLGRLATLTVSIVEAQREPLDTLIGLAGGRPLIEVQWSPEPVEAAKDGLVEAGYFLS